MKGFVHNMDNNREFTDNKIENNIENKDNHIDEILPVGFEKGIKKTGKKKRIPNFAYNIMRLCAFAVAGFAFAYAAYDLTDSYLDYISAEEKYSAIDEMFQQTQNASQENATGENTQVAAGTSAEYEGTITKWVWDYNAMLQYNDESKGYIKLDGTRIQYPIVQHSDNKYYLLRGSDKISNGGGAIFIDSRCAGGLDARMSVVYGHNMLDGSMFKDLMNFSKEDFCRKNQTFDIYVGNRHYVYYVFSSFRTKADNEDIYKFGFKDDDDFTSWIDRVAGKSNYDYDCRKPDASDKILMCSTCVDNYGNRMVVCMFRGEEVVD